MSVLGLGYLACVPAVNIPDCVEADIDENVDYDTANTTLLENKTPKVIAKLKTTAKYFFITILINFLINNVISKATPVAQN